MTSLLENLNPQQLAAVTLPNQSALILAGAGSGKTRVLTTRIAWLIQSAEARPHNILAVTFTNKAAKEMLLRLSAMLPINMRTLWMGTFHGLCNRFLRAHYREAGLSESFQILDSGDQISAIKRLLKTLNIDDEKYPPKQLQYFINDNKEQGLRPKDVEAYDDFSRKLTELYAAYEEQCQREGVVDFAELLLRMYELLQRNASLREHYQNRFKHILVDEFQDTNHLQYQWLKLLAGNSANIFAVGDDDQSIYRFRGAQVGNMSDFEREFNIKEVIRLEQNYRSQGNILDSANHLIKHNERRLGKNLWTEKGKGEPLHAYTALTDTDEAKWVIDEVKILNRAGTALSNIAILYRSNAQSRVLEHALFNIGMPYRVYGGLRFFERQEIKNALAYLRLINNPDEDNAFLRVVNLPARGIGNRSLEPLQEAATQNKASLFQAAKYLSGKANAVIGNFIQLIEELRQQTQNLSLPEIIKLAVEHSGLKQYYEKDKEGADRLENLRELENAAAAFISEEGAEATNSLAAFLAHAALEAGEHQASEGKDALQLMTVHAAKGLEFDAVFVTGLEEGLFPHENSLLEKQGIEEERRLMYVAMTRARKRLYLSLAQARLLHGQTRYNIPSRFLGEIPQTSVKWHYKENLGPKVSGFELSTPTSNLKLKTRNSKLNFQIGQNVQHPKFGMGVILKAEGSGSDARVQVNFANEGTKWLAIEFAKLTPV